jgi:hypothetical protein
VLSHTKLSTAAFEKELRFLNCSSGLDFCYKILFSPKKRRFFPKPWELSMAAHPSYSMRQISKREVLGFWLLCFEVAGYLDRLGQCPTFLF